MVCDSHALSESGRPRERLSLYLRRQYSGAHAAKTLARDISAAPITARNILSGHWPSDLHLAAIVRRFGRDVLAAVFEPEIDPVIARLQQEERELDLQLSATRSHLRQVDGSACSPSDRRHPGRAPLWQMPPA